MRIPLLHVTGSLGSGMNKGSLRLLSSFPILSVLPILPLPSMPTVTKKSTTKASTKASAAASKSHTAAHPTWIEMIKVLVRTPLGTFIDYYRP